MSQNDINNEIEKAMEKMDRDFAERQELILKKCDGKADAAVQKINITEEVVKAMEKTDRDYAKRQEAKLNKEDKEAKEIEAIVNDQKSEQKNIRFAYRLVCNPDKEVDMSPIMVIQHVGKYGVGYEVFYRHKPIYDYETYWKTEADMRAELNRVFIPLLMAIQLKWEKGFVGASESCGFDTTWNKEKEADNLKHKRPQYKQGPWKLSLHFVVDDVGAYRCGRDMLYNEEEFLVKHGFDITIYKADGKRQLMRVLGASKELDLNKYEPGGKHQNRPLRRCESIDGKVVSYSMADLQNDKRIEFRPRWNMLVSDLTEDVDYIDTITRPERITTCTLTKKFCSTMPYMNLSFVRSVLYLLNPIHYTDRNKWLHVGWALASTEIEHNVDCHELWHEWSKQGSSYDWRSAEKCYVSTPKDARVKRTWGTIAELAKCENKEKYLELIKEVKMKSAIAAVEKAHVLVDAKDFKFVEFDDYKQMISKFVTIEAVKSWANKTLAIITNSGKMSCQTLSHNIDSITKIEFFRWSSKEYKEVLSTVDVYVLCTIIDLQTAKPMTARSLKDIVMYLYKIGELTTYGSTTMIPYSTLPPVTEKLLNTYTGFAINNLIKKHGIGEGIPLFTTTRIYKHLKLIFCNNRKSEFEFFMKYKAHMYQKPYENPGSAMTIQSDPGNLKDYLNKMFGMIMGPDSYIVYPSMDAYEESFNSEQSGKISIVVGETEEDIGGGRKIANKKKQLITTDTVQIKEKYKNTREETNFSRRDFYSNHTNNAYIESKDRRYFMLKCSNAKVSDNAYKNPIVEDTKDHKMMISAYRYFSSLNIEGFEPFNPPETKYRMEEKYRSIPHSIKFIIHFVKQRGDLGGCPNTRYPVWKDNNCLITAEDLFTEFMAWTIKRNNGNSPTTFTFRSQLEILGLKCVNKKAGGSSCNVECYESSLNEINALMKIYMRNPEFDLEKDDIIGDSVKEELYTAEDDARLIAEEIANIKRIYKIDCSCKTVETKAVEELPKPVETKVSGTTKATLVVEELPKPIVEAIADKKIEDERKKNRVYPLLKPVSDDTMALMAGY